MAGGNECQSWILLKTQIRRFGDSWSWQPSTKKSSPKEASLLIDMQYLGLLLFGDVDVGLAMGSIKIEGRCNSDMAGGNECQSWILLKTRIRRFGDSWSWQPSTKKSSPKNASLLIDMQYLGLLLFGDVDVGLAMGSIKIEGRCNSDMAGGNECNMSSTKFPEKGGLEIAEADNQVPKEVAPKNYLWWSICIIWDYFIWRCGSGPSNGYY